MRQTSSAQQPGFTSLVLEEIPAPDWADVALCPLPDGATTDPATWARAVFDVASAPRWVALLMGLRQAVVGLVGIPRAEADVFDVRRDVGDEALIRTDDVHLDFAAGVGVDAVSRMVRVTTAVRLHGWRGRLYFAPVSVLHGPITQAMLRRAAARLAGG